MRVTSARNERIQGIRRLVRDAAERRAAGTCVVEGVRAAREYVRGAGPLTLAVVSPRLLELSGGADLHADLQRALRGRPDDLLETTDDVLGSAGDARTPQGVLLVVPSPRQDGLPDADGRPIVVAWEMQDPGNVGALVRIAEGAGCAAFVAAREPSGAVADPFSPRALRGAAGSTFRLPIHEWQGAAPDLASALDASGFRRACASARGGVAPDEADLSGSCAILIGSEGHGLPEALSRPPALTITIPLQGAAESLNAAAAAAIIAFEASRQRRG